MFGPSLFLKDVLEFRQQVKGILTVRVVKSSMGR